MTLRLENPMPIQDAKRSARTGRRGRRAVRAARRPPSSAANASFRRAAPLFLKKGYDNVSIDEIISVVGGSKATIYAWFGGKEGLFDAVVRRECRDVVTAITRPRRQPGSAANRDWSVIPGHGAVAADPRIPPAHGFHRPDIPRDRAAVLQTGPASATSVVSTWIAKQQKDGRIIDEDPYPSRRAVSRHADRRTPAELADQRAARRQTAIRSTKRCGLRSRFSCGAARCRPNRGNRTSGRSSSPWSRASRCRNSSKPGIERKGAIGMIGVRKISHASYETPDLEKQGEYYTDILGLTLIARKRMRSIWQTRLSTTRSSCGTAASRNARGSDFRSGRTTISTHSRSRPRLTACDVAPGKMPSRPSTTW